MFGAQNFPDASYTTGVAGSKFFFERECLCVGENAKEGELRRCKETGLVLTWCCV